LLLLLLLLLLFDFEQDFIENNLLLLIASKNTGKKSESQKINLIIRRGLYSYLFFLFDNDFCDVRTLFFFCVLFLLGFNLMRVFKFTFTMLYSRSMPNLPGVLKLCRANLKYFIFRPICLFLGFHVVLYETPQN
jgi:hypothetical protein